MPAKTSAPFTTRKCLWCLFLQSRNFGLVCQFQQSLPMELQVAILSLLVELSGRNLYHISPKCTLLAKVDGNVGWEQITNNSSSSVLYILFIFTIVTHKKHRCAITKSSRVLSIAYPPTNQKLQQMLTSFQPWATPQPAFLSCLTIYTQPKIPKIPSPNWQKPLVPCDIPSSTGV